ncbi:MAG: pirin family protein [Flavobacteriales bacterium]|jgi:redox-sensitive bicupin YhaK (pirin superfamily)|nr:pirin family protein [Flavobacteriales bacterium]
MSNIDLIIEERASEVGNFLVGRLLPFRKKRLVGPFCFIDHMGPVVSTDGTDFDVPPHPHIGLSTLTYLFEGRIMHRDSLGTAVEIEPGQVNWMTAGRGIVHSERTPEHLRGRPKTMHGMQIWVALPKELEQMAPSFHHSDAHELPAWEQDGVRFKLIAGEAFGHRSPVPVHSPLYLLELKCDAPCTVDIGHGLHGESGLYILDGAITNEGHRYTPKQLLVSMRPELCTFRMEPGTTLYIFGGAPLPEERLIHWNFVASDRALIEAARQRWVAREFPPVPGETGFVPLPGT